MPCLQLSPPGKACQGGDASAASEGVRLRPFGPHSIGSRLPLSVVAPCIAMRGHHITTHDSQQSFRPIISLSDFPNDAARVAGSEYSLRNVSSDNASSTDNSSCSDADTRKNQRTTADPNI